MGFYVVKLHDLTSSESRETGMRGGGQRVRRQGGFRVLQQENSREYTDFRPKRFLFFLMETRKETQK